MEGRSLSSQAKRPSIAESPGSFCTHHDEEKNVWI